MPTQPSRLIAPLLLAITLTACDGGGGDVSPGANHDPNVAPIIAGSWYRPAVDVTWQWQLAGPINTGYDVELFDTDLWETPVSTIASLQAQGRKVICYFSAGSGDEDRDDYDDFLDSDLGRQLDGYPSERWLDIRSASVWQVMLRRLDLAAQRGCDGVEPDNVDGYTNNPGFDLTARDQLAFNRNLANAAHQRGLSVALKNNGDQASQLVAYYDFELNEQCHEFDECALLAPFTSAGKPVLNVEYASSLSAATSQAQAICPAANAAGLRTLVLPLDLDDSFRVSCF